MSIANVDAIIFDLDGTLADTAPDICANLNHTLNAWGLSPYSVEEVKRFVGNGAKMLALRALRGRTDELRAKGISDEANAPELLERFFADLMAFYAQNESALTTLYPGVREFLQNTSITLAIFTNKPGVPTLRFLDHFGLADYFAAVLHADNVPHHKPHPEGVFRILSALHATPARTLMVGDGIPDVEVAKAAGVRSVALLQGFAAEADLRAAGPDWLASTFAEFAALLS
ncbi:MAG: HAD-IA family hydrolase [Deltaproteobacteria bacterium]|nr:HAD-IA family hydrolase [Deltaproteobacteria bacterium]MBN2671150.1 HAD-IA family hydrolase [Deltaproteobacteria bacterium]